MAFASNIVSTLDPDDFVIGEPMAVLDEFDMTDNEGELIARITAKYIERVVKRMQEREETTGDLCPIVIGHTKDDQNEDEGPPLVGYCRNWFVAPFFNTGKVAAWCLPWVFKNDVERVRRFPRRSGEVWVGRFEIDPVSFLGATTPARDLGLLKLSRDGSFTNYQFSNPFTKSEESSVPDDKTKKPDDNKPAPDAKETGSMKEIMGLLQQVVAGQQALMEAMKPPASGAPTPAAPDASGAPVGADGEPPLSDDEIEKLLAQHDGGDEMDDEEDAEPKDKKDKSRKGEEVVQNDGSSYPGGNDTQVKLSRMEEEARTLRVKLARMEIKDKLKTMAGQGAAVDPNDEELITDLAILPDDVRDRQLVRLSRNKSISAPNPHLDDANQTARGGARKIRTEDEQKAVVKLARDKKITYGEAKKQLGYE